MDLGKLPVFAAFQTQMHWAAERQKVLAENVANADSPGYRAEDLKEITFKDYLRANTGSLALQRTDVNHMPVRTGPDFRGLGERAGAEISPSGNSVVLEEQMLKVRNTAARYTFMVDLMRKNISFLKMALRVQR